MAALKALLKILVWSFEPGRINVDEATFLKASNEGSVEGEKRPLEFVKGKGELQMYFLN